ncbi:hypothetical protein GJAV_G00154890 [Gymnothorax javanicus]|nr:hypothetical protein GJAV_G00154890 [Gymnothorax javanicus]
MIMLREVKRGDSISRSTEFQVKVKAYNSQEEGPYSQTTVLYTAIDVPTEAPADVGCSALSATEALIWWLPVFQQPVDGYRPVPREFYYGCKFGYVVAFKSHEWLDWKRVTVADTEARRYVYRDDSISRSTEFQVKVKAYNSQGEGPYSQTTVLYTAIDVPTEAPADVGCSALSATEALIWWLPVFQQSVDEYQHCEHSVVSAWLAKMVSGRSGQPAGAHTSNTQIRYWRKYYDNEGAANRLFVNRTVENMTRLNEILPCWWSAPITMPDAPGDICEMFTKKPPPDRRPKVISRIYNLAKTWIYISWNHVEPMYNESRIMGYKVMIKREGLFSGELILTGKHYMFVPIPSEGDYFMEIRARAEGGDGPITRIRVSAGAVYGAESLGMVTLLLIGCGSLSL